MYNGPNMETFGARQARRFRERKGYDRASLHVYRPGPEIIGKHVTKLVQTMGPMGPMPSTHVVRVTEPFSAFKARMAFWYLGLKENARRRRSAQFEQSHLPWKPEVGLVRLGCWYERKAAGLIR